GAPDIAVGILRHVIWARVLPRNRVLGDPSRGLVELREFAGALTGSPEPEPDIVLSVHIQSPDLRRICGRRKDRPTVVMCVELRNVPRIPKRHPDVVISVGNDAVYDRIRLRHREYRHFLCLTVIFTDGPAHDPADVDVAL